MAVIRKSNTPVVLCEPCSDAVHWRFWCPFCVIYHYHGAGPGHRVAHCGKDTPFKTTGYTLRLDTKYREAWKKLIPKHIAHLKRHNYRIPNEPYLHS